jgi:hypothetical protein
MADEALERLDSAGQRGRRQSQRFGRRLERTEARDLNESLDGGQGW